jgi:hypothetical protein
MLQEKKFVSPQALAPAARKAKALYAEHYNFCRVHETLRVTPAMQLGVASGCDWSGRRTRFCFCPAARPYSMETSRCSNPRATRLARRRAARVRRAEILSGQPPRRRRSQNARCDDQGALGLRAGSSAAQGRTRPRPLRRPLMARSSSPCADGHDRLRLPPASSPRRRERGKKESPPARLNRHCRPYEKPSSPPWRALRPTNARTAAGKSADRSIESAKVVLASKPADDPGDHVLCNAPSPLAQQHIVPVRWLKLVRGAV